MRIAFHFIGGWGDEVAVRIVKYKSLKVLGTSNNGEIRENRKMLELYRRILMKNLNGTVIYNANDSEDRCRIVAGRDAFRFVEYRISSFDVLNPSSKNRTMEAAAIELVPENLRSFGVKDIKFSTKHLGSIPLAFLSSEMGSVYIFYPEFTKSSYDMDLFSVGMAMNAVKLMCGYNKAIVFFERLMRIKDEDNNTFLISRNKVIRV